MTHFQLAGFPGFHGVSSIPHVRIGSAKMYIRGETNPVKPGNPAEGFQGKEKSVRVAGAYGVAGRSSDAHSRGQIDEHLWSDPQAYYDGPVDADLSTYDMRDLAAFWAEAQTSDRAAMRNRWAHYRGKVPPELARDLIDDLDAREANDGEQG